MQSSIFTFNRIFITLFFFQIIKAFYHGIHGQFGFEDFGRFVGFWLFVIIARLIYLIVNDRAL